MKAWVPQSVWPWLWRSTYGVITVLFFGVLAWRYFGIGGEFILEYNFSHPPQQISEFYPHGRAHDREQNTSNGDYYQRLMGEPAYFTVDLPSAYPTMTVELEYQNPNQSLIELGLRQSDAPGTWLFDFKPLENKLIDQSTWATLSNDQFILLQKEPIYSSVEDFLSNPPEDKRVGTFHTDFAYPFQIDQYQSQLNHTTTIDQPLRGQHTLAVYVGNEPVTLDLEYYDINYGGGDDAWTLDLQFLGDSIKQIPMPADSDAELSGQATRFIQQFDLGNLSPGVYFINLAASDDILFTQIKTSLDDVVFVNKMHLAGSSEYLKMIPTLNTTPATVYTNESFVEMTAKHLAGLGDVQFDDRVTHVSKINTVYTWYNPIAQANTAVVLPHNDIELVTEGFFRLSSDATFDPNFGFRKIGHLTTSENLDYILAQPYSFPTRLRGWTTATATYNLSNLQLTDPTKLEFILSAPGLDTQPAGIKVRHIHITAAKDPVTLANFWQRFKTKIQSYSK